MLISTLLYLALGAISGVLAGLFGVGGGVIIVPVLIYAFNKQGISSEYLTHLAVGTSLAVICISSLSSTLAHHKKHAVLWSVVKAMVPGLFFGVVVGVYLVLKISSDSLQWMIGCYLLLVALQMVFEIMPSRQSVLPHKKIILGAGAGIGFFSAMFGIGGGSLTVPFLSYFGVSMRQAVATSAACGVPIAFIAVITYLLMGLGQQHLPRWSIGYVYLPAFFGIALLSAPFAKLGVYIAQQLPQHILKRLFALLLVIIGSSLIMNNVG